MNSVLKMASPLQLQACQQLKQLISTTTSRTNFSGVHNGLKIFPDTSSKGLHILSYNCCRYFTQYLHTGKRHVGRFVGMNSKVQNRFLIPYRTLSQRTSSRGSTGVPTSTVLYIGAAGIFMLGLGYAGVPLYRMFCQVKMFSEVIICTMCVRTSVSPCVRAFVTQFPLKLLQLHIFGKLLVLMNFYALQYFFCELWPTFEF